MTGQLVALRPKGSRLPFGLGAQKPHHFREMARIAWDNRNALGYAFRILRDGVCDGCALGTSGLRDWTLDNNATHLCLVRLNLLRLNTMGALPADATASVGRLQALSPRELRELGRLAYPLRRRHGEEGFTQVSWQEALSDLGLRLAAAEPDRIACYMTSRGLGNEVYFAAQKAMRLLGSPHIDNAARLCHSPSTAAMKRVLGVAASTCSYRDLYGTDLVVFFGSNPANDQPVMVKYLLEAKQRGTRVLTVNTLREPGLDRYWVPSAARSALFGSQISDHFYQVSTGGDQAFLYAVQQLLLERDAVDQAFVGAHTEGFEKYRAHVMGYEHAELVARSGASAEDIEAFADQLCQAERAVFVWSMGLTQHATGTQTIEALCCLALSRGYIGKEHTGLMPIRGHSGVQGGAEMGAYATVFPGGKPITDDNADALEGRWGFRPPPRMGMDTTAMLEAALSDKLQVLYAIGGNFLDTMPQPQDVERALGRIPLRIHQDVVLTRAMLVEPQDTVYVLPAKTRYEHEGGVTETTTERRVIFSPEVRGPRVGEAREEWKIAVDLACAARPELAGLLDYPDAAAVRRDIARTIAAYRGIERLQAKGDQFQWGGPRLCDGGRFPLPGERARFVTSDPVDTRLAQGKMHLSTRRGKQFNSLVQAEIDGLTGAARDHIFMNVDDMRSLGLQQDQPVHVESSHGRCEARAFAAPLTRGNVQMHWPEANTLLPSGKLDPKGLVPDYNTTVHVSAKSDDH